MSTGADAWSTPAQDGLRPVAVDERNQYASPGNLDEAIEEATAICRLAAEYHPVWHDKILGELYRVRDKLTAHKALIPPNKATLGIGGTPTGLMIQLQLKRVADYIADIKEAKKAVEMLNLRGEKNHIGIIDEISDMSGGVLDRRKPYLHYLAIEVSKSFKNNNEVLAQFMVCFIALGKYNEAGVLYSRLWQNFSESNSIGQLKNYIRRHGFFIYEGIENKQPPGALKRRLQRGRQIIREKKMFEIYASAYSLKQLLSGAEFKDLSGEDRISVAVVYFRDNFGLNLEVITEDYPLTERPLGLNSKPLRTIDLTDAELDIANYLVFRLEKWSQALRQFKYLFLALNPGLQGLIVARPQAAFYREEQRQITLSLSSSVDDLLHEFGHVIDPETMKNFPELSIPYTNTEFDPEGFAKRHQYELSRKLAADVSNYCEVLSELIDNMFQKRRDAWRRLHQNSRYYDTTQNRKKGILEGFRDDLILERDEVKKIAVFLDGFAGPQMAGEIDAIYNEIIEEAGQILSNGLQETAQLTARENLNARKASLVNNLFRQFKRVTYSHEYAYGVPANEDQEVHQVDGIQDIYTYGTLRKWHREWFAEMVAAFFTSGHAARIDPEFYELAQGLFKDVKEPVYPRPRIPEMEEFFAKTPPTDQIREDLQLPFSFNIEGQIIRPFDSLSEGQVGNILILDDVGKLGVSIIDIWPLIVSLRKKYPNKIIYVASEYAEIFLARHFQGMVKPITSPVLTGYEEKFGKELIEKGVGLILSVSLSPEAHSALILDAIKASDPNAAVPFVINIFRGSASPMDIKWLLEPEQPTFTTKDGREFKIYGFSADSIFDASGSGVWRHSFQLCRALGLDLEETDIDVVKETADDEKEVLDFLEREYRAQTPQSFRETSFDRRKPIILVNVYAITQKDIVPPDFWVEMLVRLINRFDAYYVFSAGSPKDQPTSYVEKIVNYAREQVGPEKANTIILPKMPLYPYIDELIAHSVGVVTPDTGFGHLASGVYGKRTLLLIKPSSYHWKLFRNNVNAFVVGAPGKVDRVINDFVTEIEYAYAQFERIRRDLIILFKSEGIEDVDEVALDILIHRIYYAQIAANGKAIPAVSITGVNIPGIERISPVILGMAGLGRTAAAQPAERLANEQI